MTPGLALGASPARSRSTASAATTPRRVQNPQRMGQAGPAGEFPLGGDGRRGPGRGRRDGLPARPTWDIFDGPNPDDSEWAVAPFGQLRPDPFRLQAPGLPRPRLPARTTPAAWPATRPAPATAKKFDFDDDVHSAAGITCAACHRNDISHDMIRGYEGEARTIPPCPPRTSPAGPAISAEAGKKAKDPPRTARALPIPRHKGIPEVHFERLTCTVCHSGPLPDNEPARVRTSRANRLGIFGVADWSTDLPAISSPSISATRTELLTPHRLMWPAFWARTDDGRRPSPQAGGGPGRDRTGPLPRESRDPDRDRASQRPRPRRDPGHRARWPDLRCDRRRRAEGRRQAGSRDGRLAAPDEGWKIRTARSRFRSRRRRGVARARGPRPADPRSPGRDRGRARPARASL